MKLNDLRQQTEFDCGDTARTVALLGAGYPRDSLNRSPRYRPPIMARPRDAWPCCSVATASRPDCTSD